MSFVATSVVTFIAIVVGYLSDSLPDTSLSQLDRACISKLSTIKRRWIEDGPTGLLLRRSMTTAMGVLGWNFALANHDKGLEDDEQSKDAREQRSKGLGKFILALSDQQLVTGLAVLIAGFVSPCSMPIYYFNIIAALGWFSSTTHLSTLAVLRVYFIEHPRLRNWRVVAMLFVFVLLIITQVSTTASTLDNSLPVSCAFTLDSSEGLYIITILSILVIVVFLSAAYSDRIVPLYIPDPEWSLQAWFVDAIVMIMRKLPRVRSKRQQYFCQELVKIVIETSNKPKAEQGVLWRSVNERRRYRNYYAWRRQRSGIYRRVGLTGIMLMEINYSFLGDLLTALFGIIYGITLVFVSRSNEPGSGIDGSQNSVNFGQLVPLLLMLLPLFAAGEVYFGNNINLYAWRSILTGRRLERHEDVTNPSNDKMSSPDLTRGKPFFFRKVGSVDLFTILRHTQPTSDNDSHTVVGRTSIELQDLPAGRIRRPDTETGQRALMAIHNDSTRPPSRNPEPENRNNPAKVPKTPPIPWRRFTLAVGCYIIFQALLAISLAGVPELAVFSAYIIIGTVVVAVAAIGFSIAIGLKESGLRR